MSSSSGSGSGSSPPPPLKRGKACLTCRFLKIRCDGVRPVCKPCATNPKEDPCEYEDVRGRSRYRALENTISSLQSRLHKLERQNSRLTELLDSQSDDAIPISLQLETPEPTEHSGSPPLHRGSDEPSPAMTSLQEVFNTVPHLPHPDASLWTTDCVRQLLIVFDTAAPQLGFFLVHEHFNNLAVLHPNDPSRPCEALIASVCLWGCHLSLRDSAFRSVEESVLRVALYQRSITLVNGESNPRRVLHSIQAEVLISYYFYRRGLLVEAANHAASAASLVIASGLHHVLSAVKSPPRELEVIADGNASYLPPPRNAPEMGEMLNGFWAVYNIASQIASVSTTAYCADMFDAPYLVIDCPWPLDMPSYQSGILLPLSSDTIEGFLKCASASIQRNAHLESSSTMLAKTTVLLRQTSIAVNPQSKQIPRSPDDMDRLLSLVADYRSTLPSMHLLAPSAPPCTIYVPRAISASAHIRLHKEQALQGSLPDTEMCLEAIRDLFMAYSDFDVRTFQCLSPVLGGLWQDACLFLADALRARLFSPRDEITLEMRSLYMLGKDIMITHASDNNNLLQHLLNKLPATI